MNYDLKEAFSYIANNREEVIKKMIQYAVTDTLLFWGSDPRLKARQECLWLPYLRWFYDQTNTLLTYTETFDVANDNVENSQRLRPYLENLSDIELASAYLCALDVESVILGLAFAKHFARADEVIMAAFFERACQAEAWGRDVIEQEKFDEIEQNLNRLQEFILI